MIEQILFLVAFFSFIWILIICLYWSGTHSSGIKNERDWANKKLNSYTNTLAKIIFYMVSSYILHPIIGAIIALLFILLFLLY